MGDVIHDVISDVIRGFSHTQSIIHFKQKYKSTVSVYQKRVLSIFYSRLSPRQIGGRGKNHPPPPNGGVYRGGWVD